MLTIDYSRKFSKHLVLCQKRGLDLLKIKEVIRILAETGTLPQNYNPHRLHGNYEGCWEAHIEPDWLIIWKIEQNKLVLVLVDTGTHSDLFK